VAGAALLVHGKGGKLRTVPLGDDLAAAIGALGRRPAVPGGGTADI
jgi:integrase/recombinase XerC